MTVDHFRAPMRSRLDEVPPYAGVARGLEQALCGIGGRLPEPPGDLDDAIAAVDRVHGERFARRLTRFAGIATGSVMWTRDSHGQVFCGVLTGAWHYDRSRAAYDVDLVHVRDCAWDPVDAVDVPIPVQQSFARGGRNFQRIAHRPVARG